MYIYIYVSRLSIKTTTTHIFRPFFGIMYNIPENSHNNHKHISGAEIWINLPQTWIGQKSNELQATDQYKQTNFGDGIPFSFTLKRTTKWVVKSNSCSIWTSNIYPNWASPRIFFKLRLVYGIMAFLNEGTTFDSTDSWPCLSNCFLGIYPATYIGSNILLEAIHNIPPPHIHLQLWGFGPFVVVSRGFTTTQNSCDSDIPSTLHPCPGPKNTSPKLRSRYIWIFPNFLPWIVASNGPSICAHLNDNDNFVHFDGHIFCRTCWLSLFVKSQVCVCENEGGEHQDSHSFWLTASFHLSICTSSESTHRWCTERLCTVSSGCLTPKVPPVQLQDFEYSPYNHRNVQYIHGKRMEKVEFEKKNVSKIHSTNFKKCIERVPEYFASTWYIDLTLNKIQLLGSSQRFGPDINDRVSIHTHSVHHKSATGSDPRAFLFWKQRDMRREGRGGEWCVIEYVYIRSIHIRYIMEINQAKT